LSQQAVLDVNLALNQLVTEVQPGEYQKLKSHHEGAPHDSNFNILKGWRDNWGYNCMAGQFTVQPNTEPPWFNTTPERMGTTQPYKNWARPF